MNANDLLDYSLGRLDGAELERFEREAADDPDLASKAERLARNLRLLLDDGQEFEPPPDLTRRTLELVARHRRRRSAAEFGPVSVPFRWADVAVAAGVFLASVATLLPAVNRSRAQASQTACALNLQRLGFGLRQYADVNQSYPYIDPSEAAPYVGNFGVLLRDAGYLPDASVLDCPSCDGPSTTSLPNREHLCEMDAHTKGTLPCMRTIDYAYPLGHNSTGKPGPLPVRSPDSLPLLADRPVLDADGNVRPGNSANHGSRGQNVFYSGGYVKWHPTRRVSPQDADMYLNAQGRLAPGDHPSDSVLAPAHVSFGGR